MWKVIPQSRHSVDGLQGLMSSQKDETAQDELPA